MKQIVNSSHALGVLIIADDLTGAADSAVAFAGAGHRCIVALRADVLLQSDVNTTVAVDTDSRRLSSAEAAAGALACLNALARPGQLVYKKIDSTLRGNWAAETAALTRDAGLAIVAPSHPATGRVVRGGYVYVNGHPLETTDIWQLEHAHRPAAIGAQLAQAGLSWVAVDAAAWETEPDRLATYLEELAVSGVGAVIVDAQTSEELGTLARAILACSGRLFCVGSGGLAKAMADQRGGPGRSSSAQPVADGPLLVVVGSLSEASERQCRALLASSYISDLVIAPDLLRRGCTDLRWLIFENHLGELLSQGRDVLLRIGRTAGEWLDPSEGGALSAALAKMVAPHFKKAGTALLTGGETARAILTAAGICSLELLVELEAGVSLCLPTQDPLMPEGRRPLIVTKAGGFGSDDTLTRVWAALHPKFDVDQPGPIV